MKSMSNEMASNRWISIRTDVFSAVFIGFTVVIAVASKSSSANAGITILSCTSKTINN